MKIPTEQHAIFRFEKLAYAVVCVVVLLLLLRTLLLNMDINTTFATAIELITEPFLWVFKLLFVHLFNLQVFSVESSVILAIIFLPLQAWAVIGLVNEFQNGRQLKLHYQNIRSDNSKQDFSEKFRLDGA